MALQPEPAPGHPTVVMPAVHASHAPRLPGTAARALALALVAMAGAAGCPAEELTTQVARGATGSPLAEGPYLVVERDLGDDGRLYVPSSSSTSLDPGLYPLPLLVFTPGFSAQESDYRASIRHLASHGFVVLGARHGFDFLSATFCRTQRDGFDAVLHGLNVLELAARTPGAALEGIFDPRQPFGAVGHSFGGKVSLWLAAEGYKVGAVVALDPVDGGDERRPDACPRDPAGFPRLAPILAGAAMPPVLVIDGGRSGSCAPAEGNGEVLFGALRRDATRLHLPLADHTDFVDDAEDGDCSVCGLCPAGDEDPARVLRLVRAGAVSFFRHRLLADHSLDGWDLPGSAILEDGPVIERQSR